MIWEPTLGKVIGMSLKDRGAILPAGILQIGHFGQQNRVIHF
jgi:hypothetical protein